MLLAASIRSWPPRWLLVSEHGRPMIGPDALTLAQTALRRLGCPVFVEVDGHFAEVNRGEPVDVSDCGVAVAVSPTVHGGDILTICENVGALPDIVRTAKALFPGSDVAVARLTLDQGSPPDAEAFDVVALPWFVASVQLLAQTSVCSITIDADVVRPSDAWSACLGFLARTRQAGQVWSTADLRRGLHAITWDERPGRRMMLLANLSDHDQVVAESDWSASSIIWAPAGRPAEDGVVPAYGVIHCETRH